MYEIEVRHDGLSKYRVIRGRDRYVIRQKAAYQRAQWDDMWKRRLAAEARQKEREQRQERIAGRKERASQLTADAEATLDAMGRILEQTLSIDDTIDWECLKDRSPFSVPTPMLESPHGEYGPQPEDFRPQMGLLEWIIPGAKARKQRRSDHQFAIAVDEWEIAKKEYSRRLKQWQNDKKTFLDEQESGNDAIDRDRASYLQGEPGAIEDYCDLVLTFSRYPDLLPSEFVVEYHPEQRMLIVEYALPSPDVVPKLKSVRYVQSRDEFVESYISEAQHRKLYDTVLFQIALRSLHELFEADQIGCLESIAFNGRVRAVDPSTGQEVNNCILSLQVQRKEFLAINLAAVDPKACFRKLKGVSSAVLHTLTPIAPIVNMNRSDKRFVASRDLVEHIDAGVNLATLDWEDFEHLVRELFAKEFEATGGEVKVTQASRDGGVDAIAFDPDPIRGGKIVIQAKRYTNIVGVSAVRDLYGTVQHEGAIKGILVSTAEYGADAYAFAKDKPLTLMDGSNLLHLLEKHGTRARIDLAEAKLINRAVGASPLRSQELR